MRRPPMQAPAGTTPRSAPVSPRVPSPPNPQVPTAGPDILVLQNQAADLSVQLAGLTAQSQAIQRQLRSRNWDPGARSQLLMKNAQLSVQIAQVEGDLATVRAQIANRQGVAVSQVGTTGQIIVPPPMRNRPNVDPEMVIGMTFALLMVIAVPSSIAFAKRIWKGKPQPVGPKVDEIAPRLDRLEQAVDAIAIEVERISEGQRFVTKILAERPVQASRAEAHEAEPAEGKPILALGAGPIEPIRVGERQAVRQRGSNTPH